MAPPQFVAVGTQAATGNQGGVGPVSPGIPLGTTTDHIMILLVETSNHPVNAIAGWADVGAGIVNQATGVVTSITVRWKRAGASETAPAVSIPAGGNHVIARIASFSGCINTGSPINTTNISVDNTTAATFSIAGSTTTVADCLVLGVVSTGTDGAAPVAQAGGWASTTAFANPVITQLMSNWSGTGDGGGWGLAMGGLAAMGTYNAITGTLTTGNTKAMMSFALQAAAGGAAPETLWRRTPHPSYRR